MSSSLVNLSLLARGVGSVKKNGHEKVDVIFEPEDYFNWADDPNKQFIPPAPPKYDAFSTPRATHSVYMPKTFITRKGALLLFSEDLAIRTEQEERARRKRNKLTHSNEDLGLKTVDDLAKSILCYGSQKENDVNLRFTNNKQLVGSRKIRPGFSARRYLSRLTRSFDDSFLDKLQNKGYISDKTLFQTNDILPHIRRRINDDLSYMPAPYRIMRQMLIAPGLLSGYSFYRMATTESDGLTEIAEEGEVVVGEAKPTSGKPVIVIGVRDEVEGEEIRKAVSYTELSQEEKRNVLTDLLVKSTINHALQKQREALEESISRVSETNKAISEPIMEDTSELEAVPEAVPATQTRKTSSVKDFNIGDAVRSYIDGHIDVANLPADRSSETGKSLKGSKKKTWSAKSSSSTKSWPDQEVDKEYISGVPVVSFKDPGSPATLPVPERQPVVIPHALSPIKDVSESLFASRETTFNKTPVLPPIHMEGSRTDDTDRALTTELSNLTQPGSTPLLASREPTQDQPREKTIDEEEDDKPWGGDIDEADILKKAEVEEQEKKKEEAQERRKQKELQKRSSQGSLLSTDDKDTGVTDKVSRVTSQASKKADPSPRGSLIWAPGGEVVTIGGTVDKPEEEHVKSEADSDVGLGEEIQDDGTDAGYTSEMDEAMKEANQVPEDRSKAASRTSGSQVTGRRSESQSRASGAPSESASQISKSRSRGSGVESHHSRVSGVQTARGSDDDRSLSQPMSERELVSSLTEHAHRIASAVLSQPDTGTDLMQDAQAAAALWLEHFPVNNISRSQSLQELSEDYAAAMAMVGGERSGAKSADPTAAEYKDLLKETLATALSKATGSSQESIAQDLDVDQEVINALVSQSLDPDDIEIVQDTNGKHVIRTKSARTSASGQTQSAHESIHSVTPVGEEDEQSVGSPEVAEGDATVAAARGSAMSKVTTHRKASVDSTASRATALTQALAATTKKAAADPKLDLDILNYGEADKPPAEKGEIVVRPEVTTERKPSQAVPDSAKSKTSKKSSVQSATSAASEGPVSEQAVSPEQVLLDVKSDKGSKSAKSSKSVKSTGSKGSDEAKSKKSEDKEEFVVGKVPDKKFEALGGASEESMAESKPKKPPIPKAKPPVKKKQKKQKKTKKQASELSAKESSTETVPAKEETEPIDTTQDKVESPAPSQADSEATYKTEESEDMEFIIVRDEFPNREDEEEEAPSVRQKKSAATSYSAKSYAQSFTSQSDEDSDDSNQLKSISNKEARAAKRAAQAARRREDVERKRREREEQTKKERDEAERQERLKAELDEERRLKDEKRRLEKLQREQEKQREEEEELARLRRAQMEGERERRQREEYARKLEDMKRKKAEEDRRLRELQAEREQEEEERRKAEEEMMKQMAEQERLDYERRKREEEEQRKIQEEQDRIRREEEARIAMEEAKRLAEEMARKQAEMEARLQFCRGLQLESSGLEHTQDITRAFVFSYYELLQWLGLEVPEFEAMKDFKF